MANSQDHIRRHDRINPMSKVQMLQFHSQQTVCFMFLILNPSTLLVHTEAHKFCSQVSRPTQWRASHNHSFVLSSPTGSPVYDNRLMELVFGSGRGKGVRRRGAGGRRGSVRPAAV